MGEAMTVSSYRSGHHTSTARQHMRSMQAHISASRHYQVGKDYAHAAHQALVAHGHALRALECAQQLSSDDVAHDRSPLMRYLNRFDPASAVNAVALPIQLDLSQRHLQAAEHHQLAAQHHVNAASYYDAGHYVRAAHETRLALDHGKHGLFHGNEAAKHHTEHYGSHPSAELA